MQALVKNHSAGPIEGSISRRTLEPAFLSVSDSICDAITQNEPLLKSSCQQRLRAAGLRGQISAEDVIQELYLKLLRASSKSESFQMSREQLYVAANNLCQQMIIRALAAKRGFNKCHSLGSSDVEDSRHEPTCSAGRLEHKEMLEVVAPTIRSLSEKMPEGAVVANLRAHDMRDPEIRKLTEIQRPDMAFKKFISAVRKRLSASRSLLQMAQS